MKIRYILLPLCALMLGACTASPPVPVVSATTVTPPTTTSVVPSTTETTTVSTTPTTTTTTTTEQPAPPAPAPVQTTEQPVITEDPKPHGRRGEFCSPHGAVSAEGYVCTYKGKAWRWE